MTEAQRRDVAAWARWADIFANALRAGEAG
ncbi:MAG: hypothetical protein QOK13_1780, partial [Gaiellaceae bacterium]|nr:hypothetical protein [Gaiellaceae bacterium]